MDLQQDNLTDDLTKPQVFLSQINTLKEKLPSILDDFKKYYVFYNKNPEYSEYQQMFENSLRLIDEADLIFTHIFPYSPRLGTPASKMKQLDKKIIKDRTKILRHAGEKQLEKYLSKQVGKEFTILVEKNNLGKTTNFLNVRIEENLKLLTNNLSQNIFKVNENSLFQVKIVSHNEKELIANLV
jgi:tRNA A37 methylthiotransferase MiaB